MAHESTVLKRALYKRILSFDAVTSSQQDNDTTGIKFPFDSESRITSEPISHYKPVLSFDYLLILHDFSKDAR